MKKDLKNTSENCPESQLSRGEQVRLLFEKYNVPLVDLTEEMMGQTSIMFISKPKIEQTDSAEACLRNLNRRKKRI